MSDVMHKTATEILEKKRTHLQGSILDQEHDDKDIISILRVFSFITLRFAPDDISLILVRLNEKAKKEGGEQLSDIELTGQMT